MIPELSEVAREVRDVCGEVDRLTAALYGTEARGYLDGAEPRHAAAFQAAHQQSTTLHPERKVAEHRVYAEQASFKEWAEANALKAGLTAAKARQRSMQQLLSAMQTQVRAEAAVAS